MPELPRLLMLIGAATPPGRLAAAVGWAATRVAVADIGIEIMNLAEAPIEICDGRPLESYGAATRGALDRGGGRAGGGKPAQRPLRPPRPRPC
jgi:hypothetical protein